MADVTLYAIDGTKKQVLSLDDSVFGVKVNPALVHEAVVAQTAAARVPLAHTKTRAEVSGSGKKPWKQKGTGRARHGSRRSPLWSGGGITFGPRSDRRFSVKMNKRAHRKALAMVLSDKVAHDRLIVLEGWNMDGKTRTLASMLERLPSAQKTILILTTSDQGLINRASHNLPRVSTLPCDSLNIVDLLRSEFVLATQPVLQNVTERYKQRL